MKIGDLWSSTFNEVRSYGFSDIVRMYCGYPAWLPVTANIYHGWYIHPPRESDLNGSASSILVFNKRQKSEWERESRKPAYVVGAPFVHYRRLAGIKKSESASGTIAYPGHDATLIDAVFDQRRFCEKLEALEEKYKPITVSVLETDIKNKRDRMYREFGFNVVSPGGRASLEFAQNFYQNLRRHKYSCGNHIGTNILYSIELGIPFFLIGEMIKGRKRGGGEPFTYNRTAYQISLIDKIKKAFSEPVDEISNLQKEIIYPEIGIDDCVAPEELKAVLLNSFLKKDFPALPLRAVKQLKKALLRS